MRPDFDDAGKKGFFGLDPGLNDGFFRGVVLLALRERHE
jgi:hypothetical protein